MKPEQIHRSVRASSYKPWQVYYLAVAIFLAGGLYLDIAFMEWSLNAVDSSLSGLEWVVILGIQGVLIGFVAEFLYEQGNRYAKAGSPLFGSKDRILAFRVGVMTIISGAITLAIPIVVTQMAEYLIVQTTNAVVVLGIFLVHEGSSNWRAQTEWPAIVAGTMLTIGPSIL